MIGDVEIDKVGHRTDTLRITQYKLDGYDTVRIGFNEMQADTPMLINARLDGNVLYADRENFGIKHPLTSDIIAEVRQHCINPVLNSTASTPLKTAQTQVYGGGVMLTAVRTFLLDTSAISGVPIFAEKKTKYHPH